MTNLFEPKRGMAQWEIVVGVLATKNIDDIVTDEELLAALGPDFPRAALSSVFGIAMRRFRDNKRTFERVRTVGWRMVKATEHSRLARKQQIKSVRRIKDAVSISASTDLSKLTQDQVRVQRAEEVHLRRLLDQVSRRVDKVEQRVGVVEKDQITTDEKVDRLKDLLRRHGISDDE